MPTFNFHWKKFDAAWLDCNANFQAEQQVSLLHAVKRVHQQPAVSLENPEELTPVNAAVRRLLCISRQNPHVAVVETALHIATELATARDYSVHHIRVKEDVAIELMVQLNTIDVSDYQRMYKQNKLIYWVDQFLGQYKSYHRSKYVHPEKPDHLPESWLRLCINSGKTTILEQVDETNDAITATLLTTALYSNGVRDMRKAAEILRRAERTDVVNFQRRWVLSLLFFQARAGQLNLFQSLTTNP